ncbi:ribosome maturation factor [Weissella confusa]|uniref:ribosome maturation factor n=1 Tax=Weissella confusa TaxID=1583 RepID=UPI001081F3F7|nr:ribosome maturation factor [Weissella confusa]TGE52147.1 ribosome maturation factor [Weissella confusa]TGE59014.1 ribosome maturation factor [Weissella confusa]TGE59121.1 ribosome maturation factor [Weissella confusa]
MANVVETVQAVLTPELADHGFDLWDVIYEKQDSDMVLRVLVDRLDGAINMDDLVMLTELIGERLDQIEPDPFPEAYLMDVSSPGAERELKRPQDFEWALEKYIHVKLNQPMDGQNEIDGELTAVTDDELTLAITVKEKRKTIAVPRADIKSANLTISQERILTTPEDFEWAMNKMVRVSTYQKIDGKKDFAGELTAVSDETLTITMDDDSEVEVPRAAIAQARQANNF